MRKKTRVQATCDGMILFKLTPINAISRFIRSAAVCFLKYEYHKYENMAQGIPANRDIAVTELKQHYSSYLHILNDGLYFHILNNLRYKAKKRDRFSSWIFFLRDSSNTVSAAVNL